MDAGGGERQHHVAGGDVATRQYAVTLDRADGESGEIEVLACIHAGHFGGLAADQRRAGLAAALGDARDDSRPGLRVELPGGEIIEEEQRLRPLDDEVVDAHGDQVDADRVENPGIDGDS